MDINDMAKMILPLTTIKCANGTEWEGRLPAAVSTYLRECTDEIARLRGLLAKADLLIEDLEKEAQHYLVMSEACPTDEKHCACVPILRAALAEEHALVQQWVEHGCELTAKHAKFQTENERLRAELDACRAVHRSKNEQIGHLIRQVRENAVAADRAVEDVRDNDKRLEAENESLVSVINELCPALVGETHEETLRRTMRELREERDKYASLYPLRELCHKSLHTLLRAGDALNWPDDVEDAITELRKTLGR